MSTAVAQINGTHSGILPAGYQELGRIRTGDKGKTKGGKEYPKRLENFRLTSANKPRLIAASNLDYIGGEVTDWPEAPQGKQFQLYTETNMLPVVVPPFNAFSQQNEIWQGGECRLRCDGEFILHSAKDTGLVGSECYCMRMAQAERLEAAKKGKACQTVTRLNLIMPDIPGIGVWRIETRSYYAGIELQGAAALLQDAAANGTFINAWLQIETRSVRRRVWDAQGGSKVQTQTFPVITLQPEITMRQLMTRNIPAAAQIGPPAEDVRAIGQRAAAELSGQPYDEIPPQTHENIPTSESDAQMNSETQENASESVTDDSEASIESTSWRDWLGELLHDLGNRLQQMDDEDPRWKAGRSLLDSARAIGNDEGATGTAGEAVASQVADFIANLD